MEDMNERKGQIKALVSSAYKKYSFLQDKSLEYYENKAYDRYLNSNFTLDEIIEDIAKRIIELREEYERKIKEQQRLEEEMKKQEEMRKQQETVTPQVIQEVQEPIENTSQVELNNMFEDNTNDSLEDKITITNEKPKVLLKEDNKGSKGFALFLSIIIGILVVIAMILVTMISYTLIK